jgi:photosystem II stability/assembly factor-like uncharacterized protein
MKTKLFSPVRNLLTAALLFIGIGVFAQWSNIYNHPGSFNRIRFVSNTVGFIQDYSTLKKTTNGGISWTNVDSLASQYMRTDMYWLNANEGFALFVENLGFGNYQGWIRKTANAGASWSAMQQIPVNAYYNGIWFSSSSTGYVVGNGGRILKTTNGGTSWVQLNSGTTDDLYSIYLTSTTVGWVGGDNGRILKTTNAGSTWTSQFSSINYEFQDLWFTDANNGMAVGTYGMMRTTNGGTSWTAISGLQINQLLSVMFPSADTGYVSAIGGTVYRTIDGGANWLAMNQIGIGYFARDLWFTSNDIGYVVADYSGVWKTTTAGFACPGIVLNGYANPDTLRGCANQNIQFNASGTALNNYVFTFNPSSYVTYQSANTYLANNSVVGDTVVIYATMTDPFTGCPAQSDSIVLITNAITYSPPANGPVISVPLCPGDSVVLDMNAGANTYSWQPLNATTQTITVNSTGQYTCVANGCSLFYTYVFNVYTDTTCLQQNCAVDAGLDIAICNQPVQLIATPISSGNNYVYTWSPANLLQNANGQTVYGYFGAPGVHNQPFVVTMTDTVSGCVATDTVIQSAYMQINGTHYVCPGDSLLMDFGPGGINYQWQHYIDVNSNLVILGQTTQTLYVSQPGTYMGYAVFPNNCIINSTFTIVDSCLVTSCSVYAGSDTVFCQVQGQLNATPGTPGIYTYSWSPAIGLDNPNVQNPNVVSGVHNQQYVVTMIDAQNNCTATDTVIVSAYYFIAGDTTYMCNNQPVTLDFGPGGISYVWQNFQDTAGNNFPINQFTQTLMVNQAGTYFGVAFFQGCGALTSIFYVVDSCNVSVPNVWPGDCNYDLTANMADALHIGLAYNTTGPTRPNASNQWYAQPMTDWSQNYVNCNYKHGDADGNGLINVNDTLPISLNYSLTHPFRMGPPAVYPATTAALELVPNYDTCGLQTLVTVDIRLGSLAIPVDSIYGISFRITSDAGLIDTTLTTVNLNNTWLGTPGTNMFHFQKHFPSAAIMDVAEVGTNHVNRMNGNGSIGSFLIVTTDNLSGIAVCHFTLSDITAVTVSQQYITMNTVNDSVVIDPSLPAGVRPVEQTMVVNAYPNPANSNVTVETSTQADQIEICDMTGRVVMLLNPNSKRTVIETTTLANGIYFLRITSGTNVSSQKLTISH